MKEKYNSDDIRMRELEKKINEVREREGQLIDHSAEMLKKESHRKRMELVCEYLKEILQGKSFLDIGCAEGIYCDFAEKHGASLVLGVDVSPSKIEKARERYPNCKFIVADGADLSAVNDSWDIILSSETIQHVIDYKKFVIAMRDKLSDNGEIIITAPNLSKTGENTFAEISEGMSVDELLQEVGGGGFGKQNAVWKFNTNVLIDELKRDCGLNFKERIPVDTPDGEIKELWTIMIFKKRIEEKNV